MNEAIESAVGTCPAAPPPAADSAPRGYIPVLDGLRAISIGAVLFGHILDSQVRTPWAVEVGFRVSSTGVSVFFVVSGYLITLLLLREEHRAGSISLKGFYARRALRIFPAFYAYFLVFAAMAATGLIRGVPWYDYVASLTYVRNCFGRSQETSHLWSLSLEEQFYLIWPTVMVLVAAGRRQIVLAAAVLAFTAWRAYLVATGRTNWWFLYIRPDQRMDTILIGCGLALAVGGMRFERLSRAVLERAWFAPTATAALLAWLVVSWSIPYAGVVEYTTVAILIAGIIHWLIRNPGSVVSGWLCRPWMLFLGRLSYSLYLWQGMFLCKRSPELDLVRRFPLDLALTFGCALASYYIIERPFLALKDRYFK